MHRIARRPSRASLLHGLALAALASCSADVREPAPSTPAPTLTMVDSVVLADTGSLTLGGLANAGLHVTDDAIWVGDPQNGRVIWFARDGQPVRPLGTKGKGPGELQAPGPLAPLGDDRVAVWDYSASKLLVFDARDGAVLGESPVREQAFPIQLQATGDTIWTGVVSLNGNTGALRVTLADGRVEKLAPVPAEYANGLAYSFPYSVALRSGDALLVGYAGDHRVFRHHDDGSVDSIAVPARLRRGVPPDILRRLTAREYGSELPENVVSTLSRMWRLADGSVALVHYDVSFDPRGDEPAEVVAWLTVLDPSFERVCTDARLPLIDPALPSLAFRGDTLFALEHVIGEGSAEPVLRAFRISTAGCEWMAVARGGEAG